MSLMIDIDKVTAVLIAGTWYQVVETNGRPSFNIDAYEYVTDFRPNGDFTMLVAGGNVEGVPSTGFTFKTGGVDGYVWVSGPLTAIQAVRTNSER